MNAPDPFDLGCADREAAIAAGEVSSEKALERAARIRAASEANQVTPQDEPGAAA